MAMDKLFKGILQYKSTDTFTKEAGYIYFVREFVDGNATGNAEVWFGTRKYGNVEATRLAQIESDILALDGRVDAIEAALGAWESQLGTVAAVVKAHNDKLSGIETTVVGAIESAVSVKADSSTVTELAGRVTTAEGAIDAIEESLATGATAEAIAAAQSAADKAQGEVDALETRVDAIEGEIDAHTENGDIHVTAAEKTRWSAAAQDVEDFFNGALEDGAEQVKDTLREIQDYINSDASAAATMAENITKAQNAADKAQGEVDALEKVVGDGFSETKTVASEIARVEGIADAAQTAQEVSDAIDAKIADLNSASHTHANKELLDTYTQTEADLADAVSKKHEHSNKTELDKIAEGDKAKWDEVADRAIRAVNFADDNGVDYIGIELATDQTDGTADGHLYVSTSIADIEETEKKLADAYAVKSYVDSQISTNAIYYGGDDAE